MLVGILEDPPHPTVERRGEKSGSAVGRRRAQVQRLLVAEEHSRQCPEGTSSPSHDLSTAQG
jgi:hypothetical protein